ncbi:uncharacterized protein YneF (UPF0154 family) [Rhabdobacter roseus]|uniref:Uncharacterized protein YneF (UPF0154 family) n=1 Tax=Rhabdobacter roseus TaxID=1655419 RepID=A0A840TN35_9BACT|nr:histidine kinase [Rhabdobacter roseus]MBB5282633.1 uncharacterized protein YneF (UPF0154 family) [Rhabdobacter roseus]
MRFVFVAIYLLSTLAAWAKPGSGPRGDSWQQVRQQRKGVVSVLWYNFEPFTYRQPETGQMQGIEYELMEAFIQFINQRYGFELRAEWVDVGTFENVYAGVKQAGSKGVFGLSYFSITEERKTEVHFAPPYMPDLNVVVTNNALPFFTSSHEFVKLLPRLSGYTMANTTMEQDMEQLKATFYPGLRINRTGDDYVVMEQIARDPRAFGYMPLIVYLIGLQKGIKIKRQEVLPASRPGFAAIYPLRSDWEEPLQDFFTSEECRRLTNQVVQKYLGAGVSDLMYKPFADSAQTATDLTLLSLEKEIVTQRLIAAALEVQQQKSYRNLTILAVMAFMVVAGVLYGRFVTKKRLNDQLVERSRLIQTQNEEIERMNKRLEMKVLQAQVNPHFIFNSLNAIQYFVSLDEKRQALGYIAAFSKFMRLLLHNASALETSIPNEASMLDQYLALEKMRFSGTFSYTIRELDQEALATALIPSLVVHSFVENALYHGVLNRPGDAGLIEICFQKQGDFVKVVVEDNGVGRAAARQLAGRKKGSDLTPHQQLVRDRLALLNEQAEQHITVSTLDLHDAAGKPTGTRVELLFPIRS